MYNLNELKEEVRKGITNPAVRVTFDNGVLDLTFDKKIGFEGYEDVSAKTAGKNYRLSYWGMACSAFDTFLNDQDSRQISESELLKKLKEKVLKSKTSAKPVHSDDGEQYSPIVGIQEEGDLAEINKSFRFFLQVFNRKK